jgi:hypothetical protein
MDYAIYRAVIDDYEGRLSPSCEILYKRGSDSVLSMDNNAFWT